MPLCTVAIPAYNRPASVRRAIESALAQDLESLEVLVVDDVSTDGAWEAIQDYTDPRLRRVRNEQNLGLFANFNRCLELAQGEFIRILCNDDRLVPGCLAYEVGLMARCPDAALLSSRARRIDEQLRAQGVFADHLPPGVYPGADMIGHVFWIMAHYCYNPLNYPSGILLRGSAVHRTGGFSSDYRLVGDLDYWMRMMRHGNVIIADHIGSEVMAHSAQEGETIMANGACFAEWFQLVDAWSTDLRRLGLLDRVRAGVGACSIWAMSYFWRRGRRDVARLYWRTATSQGIPPVTLAGAVARYVVTQCLLRIGHIRFQPPLARVPLPSVRTAITAEEGAG